MKAKYRTIIADDEPLARERLKKLLEPHKASIEIIDEAQNGLVCVEKVDRQKPDLLFLDIQMPGLDGFQVLQQLTHTPVIIFCTAYDQYALQAFNTKSIDYIVKPLTAERLARSIEKLDFLASKTRKEDLMDLVNEFIWQKQHQPVTTLPVKLGDRMLILHIEDISFFEAEDKYVSIHTIEGKTYISDYTLKDLEDRLNNDFIRIQRGLLICKNRVKEISKHSNMRWKIKLNDMQQSVLISGRNYAEQVKMLVSI